MTISYNSLASSAKAKHGRNISSERATCSTSRCDAGRFHVLTLVDGERIRIRSIEHPERYFDAEFMDMVVVPADMGRYVIENLRTEPICVHKTMLKDGFDAE